MIMIKLYNSQIEFVNNEKEFLDSDTPETVIVVLDKTEAVYGKDGSCNIEYCKTHNIPYVHQEKLRGGGCIIGVKGNIFIDIKRISNDENLSNNFAIALCKYFKNKGLNSVRCDNNDVLIDNFKVASGCENHYYKWQYLGYQISINQDIETIKNVCNKPMIKIPKGLSEYGITTEEMIEFCKNYWINN